jgi:hypothetical protein
MSVRLHIERVVLEGFEFDAVGAAALRQAIESRLTALLATDGVPHGLAQDSVQGAAAGTMGLGSLRDPKTLGTSAAENLYGQLGART